MELTEVIESYLLDTKQISRLGLRQARILSRSVASQNRADDMRIILLLNLAALQKGAPRTGKEFLLRPFQKETIERYTGALDVEQAGRQYLWQGITDTGKLSALIDDLIADPSIFGPLCGPVPSEDSEKIPLLIVDSNSKLMGFSRYWCAVLKLEAELRRRLEKPPEDVSVHEAACIIANIFGKDSILSGNKLFHWRQAAAAALALRMRFLIISGGPGTGKTSVVIQILRALMRFDPGIKQDRIVLCAPTGRAKARMGESLDKGISGVEQQDKLSGSEGSPHDFALKNLARITLHGLLGVRPDGSMKYHKRNPLPYQVIVVDEASMVDLHLFAALMEAASADCRIILLGDMHQLPSVEAGAVLGDLTERFLFPIGFPTMKSDMADWVTDVIRGVELDGCEEIRYLPVALATDEAERNAGTLANHAVILTHSYRSSKGVLELCSHVNRGDADDVLRVLAEGDPAAGVQLETVCDENSIRKWLELQYLGKHPEPLPALKNLPVESLDETSSPENLLVNGRLNDAFRILDGSRILVLGHDGRLGRVAINQLADRLLRPVLDPGGRESFFHGQQVILEQNHNDLDLYNGDLGLVVRSKNHGLRVVFRRGNSYKVYSPEQLDRLEPAYAMTVHKSQGSEFDEVLLVLPEYDSPLLSRQIIYTGITRAKSLVKICGSQERLRKAIETQDERPGGVSLL